MWGGGRGRNDQYRFATIRNGWHLIRIIYRKHDDNKTKKKVVPIFLKMETKSASHRYIIAP